MTDTMFLTPGLDERFKAARSTARADYEDRKLAASRRLADQLKAKGLVKDSSGRLVAKAELATSPQPAAPKPAASAKPSTMSSYGPKEAATAARLAERKRWETVMLSSAAKGREEMAAKLLAKGEWAASEIIANLPHLHAENAAQKAAESAGVWDAVIAKMYPNHAAAGTTKRDGDAISAMTDRNIAKLFPGQTK